MSAQLRIKVEKSSLPVTWDDFLDVIDEILSGVEWGEATAVEFLARRPLPTPPGGEASDWLLEPIAELAKRAKQVKPPKLEPVPPAARISSKSFGATRNDLDNRVTEIEETVVDSLELIAWSNGLHGVIERLDSLAKLLNATGDSLMRAAEQFPNYEGVKILTANGLNFHSHSEGIGTTARNLNLRRDAVGKQWPKISSQIVKLTDFVRGALDVERASLGQGKILAEEKRRELEKRLAELESARDEVEKLLAQKEKLMEDVRSRPDPELEEEYRRLRDEMRPYMEELERINRILMAPYDLCENKEPYETCTHEDLKARWRNARDRALAEKEAIQSEMQPLREQLLELANERRAHSRTRREKYNEVRELSALIAKHQKRLHAAIKNYNADLKEAKTEYFDYNFDDLTNQNGEDQSVLAASISKLEAAKLIPSNSPQ